MTWHLCCTASPQAGRVHQQVAELTSLCNAECVMQHERTQHPAPLPIAAPLTESPPGLAWTTPGQPAEEHGRTTDTGRALAPHNHNWLCKDKQDSRQNRQARQAPKHTRRTAITTHTQESHRNKPNRAAPKPTKQGRPETQNRRSISSQMVPGLAAPAPPKQLRSTHGHRMRWCLQAQAVLVP
jgi:hypothetical protein